MKRKLFVIALVVSCLSLTAVGTLAYFTAEDTAHNIITSGSIDISIIEKTLAADGTELDFPAEGIKGIMPGSKASKIVSVANVGSGEAWIRVKVESEILADGGKEKLPLELLLSDGTKVPVMTFTVESGWIDGGDGYYYYTKPVPAGEKTGIFFREVAFAPQIGNEYQNCTANLLITAQAVQTANNPIPNDKAVTDISGWPTANAGRRTTE